MMTETTERPKKGEPTLHAGLTVFIVDDDPSVRDALGLLLGVRGYRTSVFASSEDFLRAWRPEWAGCLVVDIRMPGINGLDLQQRLIDMHCGLPVIIITGHADVALARQAFKAQAGDFLEKPVDDEQLVIAIEEAFKRETAARQEAVRRQQAQQSQNKLTPREREIMLQVVNGRHNREIARDLDISVRTVEVHKARLMAKLGVSNVADLVKLSMVAEPRPAR